MLSHMAVLVLWYDTKIFLKKGRTSSLNFWERYLRCFPDLFPLCRLYYLKRCLGTASHSPRATMIGQGWSKSCFLIHLEIILKDSLSSKAPHWSQQRPSLRLHCSSASPSKSASLPLAPEVFRPSVLPKIFSLWVSHEVQPVNILNVFILPNILNLILNPWFKLPIKFLIVNTIFASNSLWLNHAHLSLQDVYITTISSIKLLK